MSRKVCVVGSSRFEVTPSIGAEIVDLVRALPEGSVLLTRGRGEIDHFVATIAPLLGMRCFAYPSQGGADNWNRDVELAGDADEVIAIVSRSDLDRGRESGTLHLVEKALDQGKPTRLFTDVDGSLVYAASSEEAS